MSAPRFMHLGLNIMTDRAGRDPTPKGSVSEASLRRKKVIGMNSYQNSNENYNPATSLDNISDVPQMIRQGSVTNHSMNSPHNQRGIGTSLFAYDQIKPRFASVNSPADNMQQQMTSRNLMQNTDMQSPHNPFSNAVRSDNMQSLIVPRPNNQLNHRMLSFNNQQYQNQGIMLRRQAQHQTGNYPNVHAMYYPRQSFHPMHSVNSHALAHVLSLPQLNQNPEGNSYTSIERKTNLLKEDEAEYLRSRTRKLQTILGTVSPRNPEEVTESQTNSLIYNLDYQMQILQGGDQANHWYQQRTPKNVGFGLPAYPKAAAVFNVGTRSPLQFLNAPRYKQIRRFQSPEAGFSEFLTDNYPNISQPSQRHHSNPNQFFEHKIAAKSLQSLDVNRKNIEFSSQDNYCIKSESELAGSLEGQRQSNPSSLGDSITGSPTKPRGSIVLTKRHDTKILKRKATLREKRTSRSVVIKPPVPRKKLQAYLWLIVYGPLLLEDTHHKVRRRKATARKTILDAYSAFNNDAQKFFLENAKEFFEALYNEKKPMTLVNAEKKGFFGTKKLSQKDLESRVQNVIMPKLRALLNALITKLASDTFPESLACFIASISENQCTPPDRFLFDFEIKRLNFSYFGALKNMAELHSKMIIGMFLLIRVFIFQFLVSPWNQLCNADIKIPKDAHTKKNLKTIASILYHIVMDNFRGKVPVVANNQRFLPPELKIRPRPQNLKTDDTEEGTKISEEDVLEGLYSKKELASFFSLRFHDVNQLKGLVEELLNSVYKLTHKSYLESKGSKTDKDLEN